MVYPLLSPELPGEFDGLSVELVALIRHVRVEKARLRLLERERVLAGCASDHLLDQIDRQIAAIDANRAKLLGNIARLVPGYEIALKYALEVLGFMPAVTTVRFNKRRGDCFTFGMPGLPVTAVWVNAGVVVRASPIEW